ncbi:hypothetical protein HMPREF9056_01294 [Actinomyces sp. oral taxon 170 str. F0386]|nr:hypothetical protein HMPREF9056_01294 [Actinomyces sp. oral taxon 170 str. F0386]
MIWSRLRERVFDVIEAMGKVVVSLVIGKIFDQKGLIKRLLVRDSGY